MGLKQYSRDEIKKSDDNVTRFIIHDKVYNVTEFLNEHPGGEEVLLDHAGRDASEDFDDVGHSLDAFTIMDKYLIGEIVESERKNTKPRKGWISSGSENPEYEKSIKGPSATVFILVGAVIAVLLAVLYFQ